MKISTLLAVGLISLGSIAFFKFGESASIAANNYSKIGTLSTLAKLRNEWIKGIVALSLERSVSQVMLTMQTPAPAQFTDLLASQRNLAAQHFDILAKGLGEIGQFPNLPIAIAETEQIKDAIATLRNTIDTLLATPLDTRDIAEGHAIIAALKATISEFESKSGYLIVENALTSSAAISLLQVQKVAWEIREFGGRARTLYAIAALHQTPLSQDDRATALGYLQRANDGWATLQNLNQSTDLPESIKAQIDQLDVQYVGAYLTLITQMNNQMDQIESAANLAAERDAS